MIYVKKVIDESIDEGVFLLDPNIGKYKLELQPIFKPTCAKKYCIVLLDKNFTINGFPIPFTHSRKAHIIEDNEQKLRELFRNEFPDHEYDIEFHKPIYIRYTLSVRFRV
ncbi:hypothetical protein J6TS1_42910 [Siminovitchia terrae]|uniref:Uncharacterized protein n=2 Tax=Siminovitchia terrae TaxID=1914933 RepID=A0ABQ4L2M2_SIMTE|nr:hypothetical protein J6TS1_42910 [Siminovitchia terrae]